MSTRYSVALATYNGEQFIAEMIQSILAQTYPVTELVISDDKSTDRTLEIIQEITKGANLNIKILVNRERLGFAKNFENALSHCTEEWIFLADQDDRWLEQKVEVCDFTASRTTKDLLIHDCIICNESLQPVFRSSVERYRKLNISDLERNVGCCMIVRRSFVDACLPFPRYVSHDIFVGKVANKSKGRELIESPLLLHRRHSDATSSYLPDSTNEITPVGKAYFKVRISLGENKALLALRSPKKFLQMLHVYRQIRRRARMMRENRSQDLSDYKGSNS
jgi:glycosyltransferase involved in cell wall biosynthesis